MISGNLIRVSARRGLGYVMILSTLLICGYICVHMTCSLLPGFHCSSGSLQLQTFRRAVAFFHGDSMGTVREDSPEEMSSILESVRTTSDRVPGTTTDLFWAHENMPQNMFQNISREPDNTTLYHAIPDETYLSHNSSFFQPVPDVYNSFNYSVLISGEDICAREDPYLLVMIPSVVGSRDRRDVIRRTWVRASETNSWPHANIPEKIKHIFLFGYRQDLKHEDLKSLQTESLLNNDVVMADFVDSYRNLSVKMLVGLQWTLKYCSRTRFVLKVDEDTFINMPLMVELLKHVTRDFGKEEFILGRRHAKARPGVVRTDRWAVSQLEYPFPYYPQYVIGATYAVSLPSVERLVSLAQHVRLIAPEDAFISGILAKSAGVSRLAASSFAEGNETRYVCKIVWNIKVAINPVYSNQMLEKLWASIVTQTCKDTEN